MLVRASSGSGGGGSSMTYETASFTGTKTFSDVNNISAIVTYGTSQLLGFIIVENGTQVEYLSAHSSFSASYSNGTLTLTWNYSIAGDCFVLHD